MRIASVSDLHLDHAANRELMPALAREIHRRDVDLVLIAGDVSHRDAWIERAIRSFQVVAPRVAYLPGNHDVWQSPKAIENGADTWSRYREHLRELAAGLGAVYLPAEPLRAGPVGIAGTCGWYDYGFLPPAHQGLMSGERRASKRLDRFQWSDARFVRFRDLDGRTMDDAEVLDVMLADLEGQLRALELDASIERVMVATHHLPFEELVYRTGTLPWEFFNAFMGSPRLGELVLRFPKVTSVLYGHTHMGQEATINGLRVVGTPLGYPRERPGLSEREVVDSRIAWWDL